MEPDFSTLYTIISIVCASCLGAVILLAVPDAVAMTRPAARRAGAWLLAIFALALALRLALPPHALFHDHNHGYRYLEVMLGTGPHHYRLEYGIGGFCTFRLFLQLLPREPASVFALNAVFGALTVLPVFALARALWRSELAGLLAALAVAVLPPHARLSATEDLYVFAGLAAATALAASVEYARSGSRRHLIMGVAALVVVIQVRETMHLVPLVALAAVWAVADEPRRRFADRAFWIAAGAAAILALPHIYFYLRYALPSTLGVIGPLEDRPVGLALLRVFSLDNVYLDPRVTIPVCAALVMLGVAVGFREHARRVIWVGGTLLLFSWLAFIKTLSEADLVMFHAHYAVYVALLMGCGAAWLAARGLAWRVGAVVAVLAIAVAGVPFLTERSNIQLEYECIERHLPRVPTDCQLVTLTNGEDVGAEPIGARFDYRERFARDRTIAVTRFFDGEAVGRCAVYYEQRICYEPTADELLDGCGLDPDTAGYQQILTCVDRYRARREGHYQPLCRRMHEDLELEPIGTCAFEAQPLDVDPLTPGRRLELGFYRIVGPRTPRRSGPDRPR